MSSACVNHFINALHEWEDNRQIDGLLRCFAPDAELSNPHIQHGPGHDACRRFWQSYRQNFDEIHSEFRLISHNDDSAFLEWMSRGSTHEGHEFEYRGVSVLEFEHGLISRFRAYFDPTDLGQRYLRVSQGDFEEQAAPY